MKRARRWLPWLLGAVALLWAWRSPKARAVLSRATGSSSSSKTPGTTSSAGPSSMRDGSSSSSSGSSSSSSSVYNSVLDGKPHGTGVKQSSIDDAPTAKIPWYQSDEYAPKPGGNTPGGSCSLNTAKYPPTASKAAFWYMINVSNQDGLLVWGKCHDGRCGYYPKNDARKRRYIPETNKLMD